MPVNESEIGTQGGPTTGSSREIDLAYIDQMLDHVQEGDAHFWRHMHWGIFDEPEVADDSPERYLWAAGAMTERIVAAGEVSDGARVLDVGCGFGGTLDYIRTRNQGCQLAGVNIDERQLHEARQLLAEYGAPGSPIPFVTADGCVLPVADQSVDHVLAVECIFHFPSRKKFFREAARVLRPGGTLALSDLVFAPGAMRAAAQRLAQDQATVSQWFGDFRTPKSQEGYERLARGTGFDVLSIEDVNAQTMPTYPALRYLARGKITKYHDLSIKAIDALESLAAEGTVRYQILSFRRRGA